jgi:hypothetical protein
MKVECREDMLVLSMAGRDSGTPTLARTIPVSLPMCETTANVKTDRGCIGSSGNVRVGRLAIGLSRWNMEKFVFPGEWRLYVKSLQLLM